MQTENHITLTRPDDWHVHVRDNEQLASVIAHTARCFGRAIIMPNLSPPVTTTSMATNYRQHILAVLDVVMADDTQFEPLMTLYLTDNTSVSEIQRACDSAIVHAVKLYPAGATTNSDLGITDIQRCYRVFEAMQDNSLPLLVHGEEIGPEIDVFDREQVFIEKRLEPLTREFPALKIVFEHITTSGAIDFVNQASSNIAATITAHHLIYNRNEMFRDGIRPHAYCLPVLKREDHRRALTDAATSGSNKFFLGTDSAPHSVNRKESCCGCAGIYTAHAAIELYAQVFAQAGALDKLEGFASFYGADFYNLPRNDNTITLAQKAWTVPPSYPMGKESLVPMCAGEQLDWQLI